MIGSVALAGCKKKEKPWSRRRRRCRARAGSDAAPVASVTVTGVDLGTAVGADMKVSSPMTTFAPKDTIIAAVSTSTSDPAGTVAGKLGAKWSFQDGQVVNEETKDVNFMGSGATNFQISKPDGWPPGKYKLEVMLDGNVVQTREFEVK